MMSVGETGRVLLTRCELVQIMRDGEGMEDGRAGT